MCTSTYLSISICICTSMIYIHLYPIYIHIYLSIIHSLCFSASVHPVCCSQCAHSNLCNTLSCRWSAVQLVGRAVRWEAPFLDRCPHWSSAVWMQPGPELPGRGTLLQLWLWQGWMVMGVRIFLQACRTHINGCILFPPGKRQGEIQRELGLSNDYDCL